MNTDFKHFLVESRSEGVLLTINREKKLNALNSDVLYELGAFLKQLEQNPPRGLVFTGAGSKAFIAGADIAEMADMSLKEGELFAKLGQDVSFALENAPYPVIACVQGFALGGGCEMALACDFIYATEQALFGLPEVKLGLIPGFGGTQRLAKVIGRNWAKELIYSGRTLKASEAQRLGLVNRLFESNEQMLQAAWDYLAELENVSPLALRVAKKTINEGVDEDNRAGLAGELRNFTELIGARDFKEGSQAFLQKRKPVFTGK